MELKEAIERLEKNDLTLTNIGIRITEVLSLNPYSPEDSVEDYDLALFFKLIDLLKTNTTVKFFHIDGYLNKHKLPLTVTKAMIELLKKNNFLEEIFLPMPALDNAIASELKQIVDNHPTLIYFTLYGSSEYWSEEKNIERTPNPKRTKEELKIIKNELAEQNRISHYLQKYGGGGIRWDWVSGYANEHKDDTAGINKRLSTFSKEIFNSNSVYGVGVDVCKISSCNLNEESFSLLAEALKANKISIVCCTPVRLSEKSFEYLVESSKSSWALTEFCFNLQIDEKGGKLLLKALEVNYTLLRLGRINCSNQEIQTAITKCLESNKIIDNTLVELYQRVTRYRLDYDLLFSCTEKRHLLILHIAIENDCVETVAFLLQSMQQQGIDWQKLRDRQNRTPLELAKGIGNPEMVQLLIRFSSQFVMDNTFGFTQPISSNETANENDNDATSSVTSQIMTQAVQRLESEEKTGISITESTTQELYILESQLNEEKKQQELLKEQQLLLENRFNELQLQFKQQKNSNSSVSANVQIEINAIKLQLHEMAQHDAILWHMHCTKEAKKKAIERFQQNPNALIFYRTFHIKIEELFLKSKSGNTKQGKLGKAAGCIEILGEIVDLAPFGSIVGKCLKFFVIAPLRHVDEKCQENISEKVSMLATLSEVKKIAESTARQLTDYYFSVLGNLSDVPGALNWFKKKAYKAEPRLPGAVMAEFGLLWIMEALEQGAINLLKNVDEQFVSLVTSPPVKEGKWKLTQFFSRLFKIGNMNQITVKIKGGMERAVIDIYTSVALLNNNQPALINNVFQQSKKTEQDQKIELLQQTVQVAISNGQNTISLSQQHTTLQGHVVYSSPFSNQEKRKLTLEAFQKKIAKEHALKNTEFVIKSNANQVWINVADEENLSAESLLVTLRIILKNTLGETVIANEGEIIDGVLSLQTRTPRQASQLVNFLKESSLQMTVKTFAYEVSTTT